MGAKCTVTLNVANTGTPYVGQSMVVADVVSRDDGTYWTTTEGRAVPLSNAPLATIDLDQGQPYSFQRPDGTADVRLVPTTTAATYSRLEVLEVSQDGSALVVALVPRVELSESGTEPPGLEVGDLWLADNPYLPSYNNLYRKTS